MSITTDVHYHRQYFEDQVPAFARVYADREFTNDDGKSVGYGDINSGDYVAEAAAVYADGVTTIASFTNIDPTIVAGSGRVKSYYTLTLHDASGAYITTVYDRLKVPSSPSVTTWAALALLAETASLPYRAEYYNREQIDQLLANLGVAPYATSVIAGKARLSKAALSIGDPIVVGDNDTRLGTRYDAYGSLAATVAAVALLGGGIIDVHTNVTLSSALVVPSTVMLRQQNNAVITKSGSGAITFQGMGVFDPLSQTAFFKSFAAGDILWSGSTYPNLISTELFDTNNSSLTERITIADTALAGKSAQINAFPRTITDSCTITQYHSVYFTDGIYLNTLNNWGTTFLGGFLLQSNTRLFGSQLAFIYESPNESNNKLISAWHLRYGGGDVGDACENIIVEHLNFIGNEAMVDSSGSNVFCNLGNAHNSAIRWCTFNRVHGYAAFLGGSGSDGNFAYNSDISHNKFIGCGTQDVALVNGKNVRIQKNYFDQTTSNNLNAYTLIDVEPNTADDVIENVVISGNVFDFTNEISDGTKIGGCINVQGTLSGSVKHVTIYDNTIIGRRPYPVPIDNNPVTTFIVAFGVQELYVYDNRGRSCTQLAYFFERCRYGWIYDNQAFQVYDSAGDNACLVIRACADFNVYDNVFVDNPNVAFRQGTAILESEINYAVTASGTALTSLYGIIGKQFYDFFKGLNFLLNNTSYTFSTFTDETHIAATSSMGTLPVKTFASATDVNTGTNVITINSHPYNTGAKVLYTAGTAKLSGLTDGAYYYVINASANTIKLASSLANALAATALPLGSTGTGTQTLTFIMETRFSNNTYRGNKAEDGITLESTGSSRLLGDYSRTVADSYAPAQITANKNDYNPGRNAYRLDLTSDASRNITGLVFTSPAQVNGEKHLLYNAGAQDIVLKHNSGSSAAGNKFACSTGADITLSAGQAADIEYIGGTSLKWAVFKRN